MITDQLEYLIKINKERVEAYRRASNETSISELKDTFKNMAEESQKNISDLVKEIQSHRQIPASHTSTLSYEIYNGWINVNPVFIKHDFIFLLNYCELTESAILNIYTEANVNLTNTFSGELTRRQEDALKSSLEVIKAYRQAYSQGVIG